MKEKEVIALNLYQQGLSIRKIETLVGINRHALSTLFANLGYDTSKKRIIDEDSVVSAYVGGESLAAVGKSHGVSSGTVSRILKKHSVEFHNYFKELPEEDVVENYNSRPSLNYWGKFYEVDSTTIRRVLVRNGVDILSQSEAQRKYRYDHNIFHVIDSEEKAYWLGFLFADGCVSSTKDDVQIQLAERDITHVQKFADFIGYGEKLPSPRISLRSIEMKTDLILHGCIPRKSLADITPEGVPGDLNKHFIRGVCDGDGYIGVYEKSASIEIVGGKTLLQWVSDNGLTSLVRPHKSIWRIRSNTSNVLPWGRWMYKDSTVYLERKYESYLRMESVLGDK